MNKRLEWFLLIVLAAAGILLWCRFSLPRYQAIDLSVNQAKAIVLAQKYLSAQRGLDAGGFKSAAVFNVDEDTDRYLQRTLGIIPSQKLLKKLHYDLFFWVVRFFKEKQKEEFRVVVSSATGEVTGFSHTIQDTAFRPFVDKDKARQHAIDFLETHFAFDPSRYILHGEDVKKFDNRLEYSFSWQARDMDIPWDKTKEKGYAKLLTNVTVSGDEILMFNKQQFEIPDGFNRYVDNLKQIGESLILVFRLIYLALMTMAIVVVVNRKHQVVARNVRPFYIALGVGIFVLMALDVINGYQSLLFDYPTTQSYGDYVFRQLIENFIGPFFIAVGFVLPALGGESLRFEAAPKRTTGGFLSPLLSSFCSRPIAGQICVGYLAAAMILGMQAFVYHLGYKYCGVWEELSWLAQASTAMVPAFTALVIGFQASFCEEAMFRLFAINLLKRYGFPAALAVVLTAAMWGFGHTGYEIFPMWFRGVEVTCIGIMMGFFYLRYGLVTAIAAHFLIDSFLTGLPYLLKPHASFDFYSSSAVVVLPLFLALIAFIVNRSAQERPLSLRFNAQQNFNYRLLEELCRSKTPEQLAVLKKDLVYHGWDAAIVDRVFEGKN